MNSAGVMYSTTIMFFKIFISVLKCFVIFLLFLYIFVFVFALFSFLFSSSFLFMFFVCLFVFSIRPIETSGYIEQSLGLR